MSDAPRASTRLALFALCAGGALVLLGYLPALQAPFLAPKRAALELSAALGAVALAWHRGEGPHRRWDRALALSFAALLGTSALSALVARASPQGARFALDALARPLSLLGVAAGASVLAEHPPSRQRALEVLTLALGVLSALGLWQHFELHPALPVPVLSTPGSTFGNRNLAAEAVALGLPLAVGAFARAEHRLSRALSASSLLLALAYLAATRARGAWLGAACGLALTLWLLRPRLTPRALLLPALALALALGVALAPARFNPRHQGDHKRFEGLAALLRESLDARSPAVRARAGLWRRTAALWRERPLLGWGPGNFPREFPRVAEPDAARDGVLSPALAPRQAHNDALERAMETGLLGLAAWLAVVLCVALLARRVLAERTEHRPHHASAAGSLLALLVLGLPGFPLEMPATLWLGGFALGLLAPSLALPAPSRSPSFALPAPPLSPALSSSLARAVLSAAALFLFAALGRGERSLRASALLGEAERLQRAAPSPERHARALRALTAARALEPTEPRIPLRRAQVLLRLSRSGEAALAAREALALTPYDPNAWASLAFASLQQGAEREALSHSARALSLLHTHPFALWLHARASSHLGDAATAAADRARLQSLAADTQDALLARSAAALLESL